MKIRATAMSVFTAAAVAVCIGGSSVTAIAAENTQPIVKIEARKQGTVTVHSRAGFQGEVAQVSQQVSYRDLDLATTTGADELASRIQQAATSVCGRLGALYPSGSLVMQWEEENLCVGGAVHGAMKQAKIAIASAEQQRSER